MNILEKMDKYAEELITDFLDYRHPIIDEVIEDD